MKRCLVMLTLLVLMLFIAVFTLQSENEKSTYDMAGYAEAESISTPDDAKEIREAQK